MVCCNAVVILLLGVNTVCWLLRILMMRWLNEQEKEREKQREMKRVKRSSGCT